MKCPHEARERFQSNCLSFCFSLALRVSSSCCIRNSCLYNFLSFMSVPLTSILNCLLPISCPAINRIYDDIYTATTQPIKQFNQVDVWKFTPPLYLNKNIERGQDLRKVKFSRARRFNFALNWIRSKRIYDTHKVR